jgi:carboxyl-terminal processing protease
MKKFKSTWLSLLLLAIVVGGALIWTNVVSGDDTFGSIQDGLVPLIKVFQEVNRRYVDKVDSEKFLKAGIDGMLETLDPYTNLVEKEEKEQLDILSSGSYGGVGLILIYRNTVVTVGEPPFLGTPAARAGIREGDQIIKVNGNSTKDLGFEKTVQQIRGLRGTEVILTIQREGESKLLDFTLVREQIKVEDITYSGKVSDGIGYVLLTRFSKNADSEMAQAIRQMKGLGCNSLILDLRSNPGGMLEAAVGVAELFLQKNATVVSTHGRSLETDQVFKSVRDPVFKEGRLIVLVNEASASASEIVAGAIQDHDRGIILGDTTFGKGLVQTVVSLTTTSALKITTSKYYTPSGRCIQKRHYSQWEDSTDLNKHTLYKTDKGRVVHAGGGIVPDMVLRENDKSDLFYDLVRKSMFFNFAVQYVNTHAKPDSNLQVTDAMMDEFRRYLKEKSYEYKHPIEKSLENLKNEAVKGGYQTDVLRDVQHLENSLIKAKEDIFANSSRDIRQALRLELCSKYFGTRRQIEIALQEDQVFQKAMFLLKDQINYADVLGGKNK